MDPKIFNASHTGSKQSVISLHKKFYRTVPMTEFSMTNHSADPNQTYLARIRKLIHFTVRIQKTLKNCKSQKNFFNSEFILKLTTPEQIPIFKASTVRGSLKIRRGS
jgi:hypothetical protein